MSVNVVPRMDNEQSTKQSHSLKSLKSESSLRSWSYILYLQTSLKMSCICWRNPCNAICITGFWIFLHQGAMRGRVGERCHTIPYLAITYHTIPYHTMPYHDHTIPHGRMLEGWPNTRGGPNTWSFNKGDQENKKENAQRICYIIAKLEYRYLVQIYVKITVKY